VARIGEIRDVLGPAASYSRSMTLLWFIIWLIANSIGDHAPLLWNPVNIWAGTLLLAIAVDLSRQHVPAGRREHGSRD
jgi:hypothetical protein